MSPSSRLMLRSAAAAAGAIVIAFGLAGAASAAAVSPVPEWTGVWRRDGGGNLYDPAAQPNTQVGPYRPDWAERYRQTRERDSQGLEVYDPTARCLPAGMPRIMNMPYPFEVLQTPGQVTIIAEYFAEIRRIYTDGRGHPDDFEPSYVGHSVGRWEGDTLVVDTVGIRGETLLDSSLAPRSDKGRVTERFRMTSPDNFEVEITLDDPVALTRPWTVTKRYRRAPAGDYIREFVCAENNRDARTIGQQQP